MAERGKRQAPKPAAKQPTAPPDVLPAEALARRSAAFLRMTQGAGKPHAYPSPRRT